jgi:glyceraldehyde-3-phosphate dehydrogenase (ferredoxin)
MTYELFSDNSGICRFHRKWAELITDEILTAHYNLNVDYKAHQFNLAQSIYNRECTKAVPWESTRLADLILGYLEHWELGGLKDSQLEFWLSEFRKDKVAAAHAYWQAIQRGIAEAFAAGAEAIPTQLTPKQSKKI